MGEMREFTFTVSLDPDDLKVANRIYNSKGYSVEDIIAITIMQTVMMDEFPYIVWPEAEIRFNEYKSKKQQ